MEPVDGAGRRSEPGPEPAPSCSAVGVGTGSTGAGPPLSAGRPWAGESRPVTASSSRPSPGAVQRGRVGPGRLGSWTDGSRAAKETRARNGVIGAMEEKGLARGLTGACGIARLIPPARVASALRVPTGRKLIAWGRLSHAPGDRAHAIDPEGRTDVRTVWPLHGVTKDAGLNT